MRNLFVAGTKLLGIVGLYWAILIIPQIGFLFGLQTQIKEEYHSMVWIYSGILLHFLLSLFFGLILIFRTEKIADMLKIKTSEEQYFQSNTDNLLRIGIILVGIYLLVSAIPTLTKTIITMAQTSMVLRSIHTSELIASILQICLGGWLSFSSSKVVHFITKKESKKNHNQSLKLTGRAGADFEP